MVKYVYDAWGNCKVLDADGNEIPEDYTDEYGFVHVGHRNPFRYRGYYYDVNSGLYYLQSRYYDPETGRFLNADTVEHLDPESINGLNLYAYCGNNPVMYSDPSGHSFILTSLAIIGIMTLLGAASGAIVNAVFYTLENPNGDMRGFWASVIGGAVSGAIMGAFSGIVLVTGATAGAMVAWSASIGAISGLAGSLTEGAINGQLQADVGGYWLNEVLPSMFWGAATGALFGLMGGSTTSAKSLAEAAGRSLAKQMTHILYYKVFKKVGSIFAENLLGDFTSWLIEFFSVNWFRTVSDAFN